METGPHENLLLTHSLMLGERLYLFARLRFVAAAGILIGGPFATYVVGVRGLDLRALAELALVLAACNVGLFLAVRPYRGRDNVMGEQPRLVSIAHISILLDYLVLTYGIWLVGGASSPFLAFYLLHAILASVLLSRRAAYALALVGYLCLATLVLIEWVGISPRKAPSDLALDGETVVTLLFVYGLLTAVTTVLTTGIVKLLRQHEQDLRVAREGLEQLADMRRSFLHVVLHDVRSPAGTVVSMLDGVLAGIDGELTPPQRGRIERALARMRGLLDLLRGLRVLADLETETLEGMMAPVDVRAMVNATVEEFLDAAEQKQQSLKVEGQADLPNVRGIDRLLREALANYISNAVKYTDKGGTIIVRAFRQGDVVRIEVADDGKGITEQDQQRLFQEFVRLGREARGLGRPIGMGLGLSIVRRIAEAHRGRAGVVSQVGQGSTFFLELPALPQDA